MKILKLYKWCDLGVSELLKTSLVGARWWLKSRMRESSGCLLKNQENLRKANEICQVK